MYSSENYHIHLFIRQKRLLNVIKKKKKNENINDEYQHLVNQHITIINQSQYVLVQDDGLSYLSFQW